MPEDPPPGKVTCECRTCESAVSPAAYLSDLLDYVRRYIYRDEGGSHHPIDVSGMLEQFYQPYGALPADCEGAEEEVRYLRVGIESLLGYADDRDGLETLLEGSSLNTVVDADGYRRLAYETLLDEWGTSLEEIHRARYDDDTRSDVAERLGIPETRVVDDSIRIDQIDDIFLDPSDEFIVSAATGSDVLSGENLETVFGLPSLVDVQADGSVRRRPPLENVETPEIQKWRTEYLQDTWRDRDHSDDSFPRFLTADATVSGNLAGSAEHPAVDPDRLSPDDFRTPEVTSSTAFEVWERRRTWVDDQLEFVYGSLADAADLAVAAVDAVDTQVSYDSAGGERTANPFADWATVRGNVAIVSGSDPNYDDLTALVEAARAEDDESEAARKSLDRLHLPVEAAVRLIEVVEADRQAQGDPKAEHPDGEALWEMASIVVGARKRALAGAWMTEEEAQGVQLGDAAFWGAARQPTEGQWSSRLDESATTDPPVGEGVADVTGSAFLSGGTGTTIEVDCGFEPDLITFIASSAAGAVDEDVAEESGPVGWGRGAAAVATDGSVTQYAVWLGADASGAGQATGRTEQDTALLIAPSGSSGELSVSVTGTDAEGFEVSFDEASLGSDVLVEYVACRTAVDADAEVGTFTTRRSPGMQTIPLGVDANYVELWATTVVTSLGSTATTDGAAGFSSGVAVGREPPSQSVIAAPVDPTTGESSAGYAGRDNRALYLQHGVADGSPQATEAAVTGLGRRLSLDYESVYQGGDGPGSEDERLVLYIAVNTGDSSLPAVGHIETPADAGNTVEVTTGFRPAAIEFEANASVSGLDQSGTLADTPAGWSRGLAAAPTRPARTGPNVQSAVGHSVHTASGLFAHEASDDHALTVLYVDQNGQVTGRDRAEIAEFTPTGFTLRFDATASSSSSTAEHDRILVRYRAWPDIRRPRPLVDPLQVDRSDLPGETAGAAARGLYADRIDQLDERTGRLRDAYYDPSTPGNSFETVLSTVYGDLYATEPFGAGGWADYFTNVLTGLDAGDPMANRVLDAMGISREEFEALRSLRRRSDPDNDADPPDEARVSEILARLVEEWARLDMTDAWIDAEREPESDGGPGITRYWEARRQRLPAWRTDPEDRAQWQRARVARRRAPIVDPDIIDLDYVDVGPNPGNSSNPAHARWTHREAALNHGGANPHPTVTAIANDVAALTGQSGSVLEEGFDDLLSDWVGIDVEGLDDLARRRDRGEDLTTRMAQLDLPLDAFSYLVSVRGRIRRSQPVTNEAWANVRNLLVQVWKRRTFGRWRREERATGVVLRPEYFTIPDDAPDEEDSGVPGPERWRRDLARLDDWQDTLESRIEARDAVAIQVEEAVEATEETILPRLRDWLVEAISLPDTTRGFDDRIEWLSERLLLDLETDACRETTRVGAAIESIQAMVFTLSQGRQTGGLDEIDLVNTDDNFDERWRWLGTYPKWKSAMGVYLYPEVVLLPAVREQRSEGFDRVLETMTEGRNSQNPAATASTAADHQVEYFRDVCNVHLEAGCIVDDEVPPDSPQADALGSYMGYAFGRATGGGEIVYYYRRFDPSNRHPERPAGLWQRIQPLDDESVSEFPGAVANGSIIYLFVVANKSRSDRAQDLGYLTYDVDDDEGWSDVEWIDLPGETEEIGGERHAKAANDGTFRITIPHGGTSAQPVEFFVSLPDEAVDDYFSVSYDNPRRLYRGQFRDDPPERGNYEQVDDLDEQLVTAVVNHGSDHYVFTNRYNSESTFCWRYDRSPDFEDLAIISNETKTAVLYEPPDTVLIGAYKEDGTVTNFDEMTLPPDSDSIEWGTSNSGITLYSIDRLVQCNSRIHDLQYSEPDDDVGESVYLTTSDEDEGLLDEKVGVHAGRLEYHNDGDVGLQRIQALRPYNDMDDARWQYGYWLADDEATPTPDLVDTQPASMTFRQLLSNSLDIRQANKVYLWETFYHVPMFLARRLHGAGGYSSALDWFRMVYDYDGEGMADTWSGFFHLGDDPDTLDAPAGNWLTDPINPHAIARGRPNTPDKYKQFTLLSEVRCLLDYANEEFSHDTAESIARARQLYEIALDLLDLGTLTQLEDPCDQLEADLEEVLPEVDDTEPAAHSLGRSRREILDSFENISDYGVRSQVLEAVRAATSEAGDGDEGTEAEQLAAAAAAIERPNRKTIGEVVEVRTQMRREAYTELLADDAVARRVQEAGDLAERVVGNDGILSDGGESGQGSVGVAETYVPSGPLEFCIPANPVVEALRRRARLNLRKIRNCRNIAGMRREVDSYGAGTGVEGAVPSPEGDSVAAPGRASIQPTNYRYDALIERAKTLAQHAQQFESRYFSALERMDKASYELLQARQDLDLAEAQVRVQDLRVTKARDGVELARRELRRANIQAETYRSWIESDLNKWEKMMITSYRRAGAARATAAAFGAAAQSLQTIANAVGPQSAVTMPLAQVAVGFISAQSVSQAVAIEAETRAKVASVRASRARRERRWKLQEKLAKQDARIGRQKVDLAQDDVRIARQRRRVSELEVDHAEDIVEFLQDNQFTNRELYRWMSEELGRIYRYFLQQAASVAKLAERQLAFERLEQPSGFIQSNYWETGSGRGSDGSIIGASSVGDEDSDEENEDRRGVTGSAQLIEDIWRLDQHEFRTDERRLQVEKTISLAALDPLALQRFRETGVLTFSTPGEIFDRDYPGQYHRLIQDVSVDVIALAPPTDGIKAMLRNAGTSRVVVGDTVFRERVITRDPASVVLHPHGNDRDRSFALRPKDSDLLRPFEGMGVETRWELRMPKAANAFDYDTIADVQFTVEYTAEESAAYREQVQRELGSERSVDQTFSIADDFADEWYDLNNPGQTTDPMTIDLEVGSDDFPANLADLKVDGVQLYFVGPDGEAIQDIEVGLELTPEGTSTAAGGPASPVDGLISTPGASAWTDIIGKPPTGTWTLELPNTPAARALVDGGPLEDILLVVTAEGEVPEWPS